GRVLVGTEADTWTRRVLFMMILARLDLLRARILCRRHQLARLVMIQGHRREFDALRDSGRGAVLVTGHIGNWDLAGVFVAHDGYPITAVFERIPRGLSDAFNRFRAVSGMEMVAMEERDRMVRAIQSRRLLVLLGDRDLKGTGLELPWFTGRRTFPRGAAALALRYNVPVLTAYYVFEPGDARCRYRIQVEPPIDFTPSKDLRQDIDRLTGLIVGRLEQIVAKYPDQWQVLQPNWLGSPADASSEQEV
ncbi:MAG: lysophospholipid acyltransferase family protein, partial [candidate division WOR-3 bacterium]